MQHQTLYQDDFVEIFEQDNEVFIKTFKPGLPPKQLNEILSSLPQIQITSFNCLNDALNIVSPSPQKFGRLKERIAITVTPDELKAFVTFNLPRKNWILKPRKSNKRNLSSFEEKKHKLWNKKELFFGDLESGKKYLIAEEYLPLTGRLQNQDVRT